MANNLASLARRDEYITPERQQEMLDYLQQQNQQSQSRNIDMSGAGLQPMNTIQVDSTGEYLAPQGTRSQEPAQFQSAKPIQLSSGKVGYLDRYGNVSVDTDQGQMSVPLARLQQNEAEARRRQQIANMPYQKQMADLQKTQAEAEKLRSEAGGGVKPQFSAEMGGYVYPPSQDAPQGRFVPVQGAPKGAGMPKLTEGQAKATTFASQMAAASNELDKLEAGGFNPSSIGTQMQTSLAGGVGNIFAPAKAQQAKQTQNQWSEAFLRVKTGAAATEPEVRLNNKTFFPQIGDSLDVINQKRQMRVQAEQDVLNMTGAGRDLATQRANPPVKSGGQFDGDKEARYQAWKAQRGQ